MSRADKVARLLAGCSGPSDEWTDMGMTSDIAPADVPPWLLDQAILEVRSELELIAFADRFEALVAEVAARLPGVTLAEVHDAACLMPPEYFPLFEDFDGWCILADTIAQQLGFRIDPNNPLLDPSFH